MNLDNALSFTDKVAVVTGGSGVLGGALAEALGEQGAAVVVVGKSNMQRAEEIAQRIIAKGGKAVPYQANVLSKEDLTALQEYSLDRFGGVDLLINAAGGTREDATTSEVLSFFDLPEEAVRWVFDLNLLGTFLACQVFGRQMAEEGGGRILNIASMGSFKPLTRNVAYSAAKAAVVNFTEWLAVHFSHNYSHEIRVNALAPGFFLTHQNRFLLYEDEENKLTARGRKILDHTPMGRFGDPHDLILPALMLLSDDGAYVHGTTLVVDGGFAAYGGV